MNISFAQLVDMMANPVNVLRTSAAKVLGDGYRDPTRIISQSEADAIAAEVIRLAGSEEPQLGAETLLGVVTHEDVMRHLQDVQASIAGLKLVYRLSGLEISDAIYIDQVQ